MQQYVYLIKIAGVELTIQVDAKDDQSAANKMNKALKALKKQEIKLLTREDSERT